MAKENPFRFSTKRADNETDLVWYEYRVYYPSTGRWLSRDPIGETGGVNVAIFARNNPMGYIDYLGLQALCFGDCGADVTEAFDNTLFAITTFWQTLNFEERLSNCRALWDEKTWQSAWMIPRIGGSGFVNPRTGQCFWHFERPAVKGTGPCDCTVGYQGLCVQARDLHYKMLGHTFKLCNKIDPLMFNALLLKAMVYGFKCIKHDECEYFEGAYAFALEGYTGEPIPDPLKVHHMNCVRRPGNRVTRRFLEWQWLPHHPLTWPGIPGQ